MTARTEAITGEAREWSAGRSVAQLTVLWSVLWGAALAVLPPVERLYHVAPLSLRGAGLAWPVFGLATVLGLWAAMSPEWLPVDHPVRLVVSGPYRRLRNPMAVATVVQGLAMAWAWASVLLFGYVAVAWIASEWTLRPGKETDLAARFGAAGQAFLQRVPRWLPAWHSYEGHPYEGHPYEGHP